MLLARQPRHCGTCAPFGNPPARQRFFHQPSTIRKGRGTRIRTVLGAAYETGLPPGLPAGNSWLKRRKARNSGCGRAPKQPSLLPSSLFLHPSQPGMEQGWRRSSGRWPDPFFLHPCSSFPLLKSRRVGAAPTGQDFGDPAARAGARRLEIGAIARCRPGICALASRCLAVGPRSQKRPDHPVRPLRSRRGSRDRLRQWHEGCRFHTACPTHS